MDMWVVREFRAKQHAGFKVQGCYLVQGCYKDHPYSIFHSTKGGVIYLHILLYHINNICYLKKQGERALKDRKSDFFPPSHIFLK